jgi:hypothetical protein
MPRGLLPASGQMGRFTVRQGYPLTQVSSKRSIPRGEKDWFWSEEY